MAKSTSKVAPKIAMSEARNIPFHLLTLSPSNVRKINADQTDFSLAEDIANRGLLQSLSVRPQLDGAGKPTGRFEVQAGGRRFRALAHLVRQKRLAIEAPISCLIRETGIAEEDSLAENTQRSDLHPLDQYRAFQALIDRKVSEDEIAARFFLPIAVVRQRLKLATVSPALLDIYGADGMKLEQLMAFTVTSDHQRQEAVWAAIQTSWDKGAGQIRRMLTEGAVKATDKRAQFVGLDAYHTAGGVIERDLFESDGGGFLQDPVLLDTLANQKLVTETAALADEGWKWAEYAIHFPYGHSNGMRVLAGTPIDLTAEEVIEQETLKAEFDALTAEYEDADELPDQVDTRFGELEAALEAFDRRPVQYAAEDIARAGVFVTIGSDGGLLIDRGYVRLEDEAAIEADTAISESDGDERDPSAPLALAPRAMAVNATDVNGPGDGDPDEDDETLKPLADRLISELTAYRTVALRNAIANHPHTAFTLLLHKLCGDFFRRQSPSCLEARIFPVGFPIQGSDLKDSPAARSVEARHKAWMDTLPTDGDALWDWLDKLDEASRMSLLAHCVSFGLNALFEKVDRYGGSGPSALTIAGRIAHANQVAAAIDFDIVDAGWRTTAANYLNRVPKPRILEAVTQARGEQFAGMIDHLKKSDMASEAERLLEDTGWTPEPLRLPINEAVATDLPSEIAPDALPAFLTDDDEPSMVEEAPNAGLEAAE